MTLPDTLRIDAFVREILELPSDYPLPATTMIEDVPGWDSLGWLRLIEASERQLGIQLPLEQLGDLVTIADFHDLLRP